MGESAPGATKVLKYPLLFEREDEHGAIEVTMPHGARIVLVDSQNGCIVLWAHAWAGKRMVDDVTRKFHVYSTGQLIAPSLRHVGSTQMCSLGGDRVWHIFEEV